MLIGLFGTGRNGSSLIGRMLDGIEDTYVHPVEEIFLSKFDDLALHGRVGRLTVQNCLTRALPHLARELPRDLLVDAYALSLRNLHGSYMARCPATKGAPLPDLKALMADGAYGPAAFVQTYLETLGRAVRPDVTFRHHLFKSIETPYIATYASTFPGMKFVHILRHPMIVCSSQKRSLLENKRQPASYLGYDWLICMLDKRWVPHAQFVVDHRDDPRHITVLYETLVANPQAEIARVAAHLGLRPPPRPALQTLFYDQDVPDWGFNPSKAGAKAPVEVVADLQSKLAYEEILSPREIDLINLRTAALQRQLGYTPSTEPSWPRVAAQYALLDKWEWANVTDARSFARALHGVAYRRFALLGTRTP